MGALLAAGGETSPDEAAGAKALCGGDVKCPEKPFLGYVLRARLLNSQFSKTAFFLKRAATERKKGLRISVFFLRFDI